MSGSSGVMAPPQPAQRMPSPYSLPLHALRLAGKCALPLILWFSCGEFLRWGLLYLATEISHGDYRQARLVATVTLMTCIVLLSMVITAGTFHALRGAMWEHKARMAAGEEDERFWSVLNRVAPTFAVIYLAWSFHVTDVAAFRDMDRFHNLDDNFWVPILTNVANNNDAEETTLARGLMDLDWRLSLIASGVAFGLRFLFSKLVERGGNKYAGVGMAFAEFAFMFCGLNAVLILSRLRGGWTEHRAVVAGAKDQLEQAKSTIPGWETVSDFLATVWPYVIEALMTPFAWLALAILAYGGAVDDARRAFRGSRIEAGLQRLEGSHALTQRSANRVIGGFQDRWVPVLNAWRVTNRGGLPLFGMVCLLYVGLRVGADYGDRAVRTLIGSDVEFMWLVVSYPVTFVKGLLLTSLSFCVLAAAYDIAATRARMRGEDLSA
ncbi:hypothetical protein [Nonomuraea sp. NPDC050310]|uniref:hypothetical protein n=1 Tax=Nonomuraea sp. NPDC050310 TaxID=3154935 RepID=UPI00340FBD08